MMTIKVSVLKICNGHSELWELTEWRNQNAEYFVSAPKGHPHIWFKNTAERHLKINIVHLCLFGDCPTLIAFYNVGTEYATTAFVRAPLNWKKRIKDLRFYCQQNRKCGNFTLSFCRRRHGLFYNCVADLFFLTCRVVTRYFFFCIWSHISTQNVDLWSQKRWEFWSLNPFLLLAWSLIHEKHCWSWTHVLWFQIPGIPDPGPFWPLIPDPIYLVTTLSLDPGP